MILESATTILGWLEGAYPTRFHLDNVRRLYLTALEEWEETSASNAVLDWIKKEPRPPTVAELRTEYLRRHLGDPELWREQLPEPTGRPEWVERWDRARAAGDVRLFPEQADGIRELHATGLKEAHVGKSGYEEAYAKLDTSRSDATVWVQPKEYV